MMECYRFKVQHVGQWMLSVNLQVIKYQRVGFPMSFKFPPLMGTAGQHSLRDTIYIDVALLATNTMYDHNL